MVNIYRIVVSDGVQMEYISNCFIIQGISDKVSDDIQIKYDNNAISCIKLQIGLMLKGLLILEFYMILYMQLLIYLIYICLEITRTSTEDQSIEIFILLIGDKTAHP